MVAQGIAVSTHEFNESRIMTVIALLDQVIERVLDDAAFAGDDSRPEEEKQLIDLAGEITEARHTLDMVAKTCDLPYVIPDQPSWIRRG